MTLTARTCFAVKSFEKKINKLGGAIIVEGADTPDHASSTLPGTPAPIGEVKLLGTHMKRNQKRLQRPGRKNSNS